MINKYIQKGAVTEIHVKDKIILVDTDEVERLKGYTWFIRPDNYLETACKNVRTKPIGPRKLLLHRYILSIQYCDRYTQGDHINGNRLDNRLENLRIVNHKENRYNVHISYNGKTDLGVSLHKKSGLYRVRFQKDYKSVNFGYFKTKEEAIKVAEKERNKFFNLIPNDNN